MDGALKLMMIFAVKRSLKVAVSIAVVEMGA